MLQRLGRLFTVKTRFEAFALIYAIAVGAVSRGLDYLALYSGLVGWVFFAASTAVVFIAGSIILDSVRIKAQPHQGSHGG